MKKILGVFIVLVAVFVGLWAFKLRQPLTPTDPYASGLTDGTPWWQTTNGEAPTPDADWVLDHDIPENYIPVLGGNELYMEVDENGNIIRYRQRTLQEDGSWLWETVNPDIPANYEPVEGLEDVYKVTGIDGTVHYYQYTRNSDDTYFFTEVDANGNPVKSDALTDDEIPANYIRVDGTNIYAVYNEYGVLIGYKERVQNADGSYSWVDVDAPSQENGDVQVGTGVIPNISTNTGAETGTSGNVTIQSGDISETKKGYSEEKIYTDVQHSNGWAIVYETIVTKTYDESGDLVSTKTDGPTEINRFPETEWNDDILNQITGD